MKSVLRSWLLAVVALLLVSCASGPVVTSDFDRSADFSAYRTFGFAEPLGTDVAGYQSLVTSTLKSAARREMEARGYVFAGSDPDLMLNFGARLERQTDVTQVPMQSAYYGYRRGAYRGWGGYGYETRVDQYVEGTLNIDVVDARRSQLVWEGVAVGRISESQQPGREAAINAAVAEIFAKYPFRAGQ